VWEERWFSTWKPPWGGLKVLAPDKDASGPKPGVTWEEFWFANGLDGEQGRMLQREVDLGVPFTEQTIDVEMVPAQKKLYKTLKRDYVAFMEESGGEVSAWSDGGLHVLLQKASTGLSSIEPGAKGSGKLDVLAQLLEDAPRSPTLVFGHFHNTIDACTELAVSMGLRVGKIRGGVPMHERTQIERDFQAGKLDVLVGSLSTVSTGLTFSTATTEIFIEHSYTPWKNEQAIKRAMVMGKTAHVHVIHLWTKGTVDVGMRSTVNGKTEHQVKALTAREFRATLDGGL
jgi:SNF2 family DNA or RNA helicase